MKKKEILVCILGFILFFSLGKGVKALTDRFVESVKCPTGYHSVLEHKEMGMFKGPSASYDTENFAKMTRAKMCIKDGVNGISNVNVGASIIYYCEDYDGTEYDVGWDYVKKSWAFSAINESNIFDQKICCPAGFPNFRDRWILRRDTCCPSGIESNSQLPGDQALSCGINSRGVPVIGKPALGKSAYFISTDPNFIYQQPNIYTCAEEYCYVEGVKLIGIGKSNETTTKTGNQCVDSYGPDRSSPVQYCINGKNKTAAEYAAYIAIGVGATNVCDAYADPKEKESCTACFKDCPTKDCSYSSLGCIQTTQNGIIVRIFQIGLGVVGAIAIARFIQAALLRQTADPTKIQESYDIITSIIIGIVVLLGSTVILRFIGVDILQMLPF